MASIELVDETFVVAPPSELSPVFADPARHRQWWPEISLTVFMDRGELGQRWSVTGEFLGSVEVWLEAWKDGTIVHHYVRVDPARGLPVGPRGWRKAARMRATWAKRWKGIVWELKREFEGERLAGTPR